MFFDLSFQQYAHRYFRFFRLLNNAFLIMIVVAVLTMSPGCAHAQGLTETTARANGKIGPKLVMPIYASTRAELEKRHKKSFADDKGFQLYPFLLVDAKGVEVGTMLLIFGDKDRSPASHPMGAEVEFRRPVADEEAAIQAVGMKTEKGQWFGGAASNFRTFVYGKVMPDPEMSSERIVVRKNLTWLVVGMSRP